MAGATIIGTEATTLPLPYAAPLIETRAQWSDDWEWSPELELIRFSAQASASEVSTCEIQRRYGNVKQPYELDYSPKDSLDLANHWVRVSLFGEQDSTVEFVGKIYDDAQSLKGGAQNPSGMQSWVASGGLRILQKIDVSRSFHLDSDLTLQDIGWIPDMNVRDHRGLLVGNRSAEQDLDFEVFAYGGKEIWSNLDYVKYLLAVFVEEETGPTWTVGGQTDILDGITESVKFGDSESVAEMLKKLIPAKFGIDYRIRNTDNGFEVNVFALIAQENSFAGVTMPKNPNTVTINKDSQIDLLETHIVRSRDRRVDQLRVMGKRIVCCCSLRGARANGSVSLISKWNSTLEDRYKAAGGAGADAETADQLRRRDEFRTVFQQLGAPTDWDLDGGAMALKTGLDGKLDSGGDFQTLVRQTLPWIPLKEGFDYSQDPAVDNNLPDHEPDVKAPLAWILDETTDENNPKYVQCDLNGISVSAPHHDWGVFLNASPNHKLALNHWSAANDDTTDTEPAYDYDTAVCTIAFESDQRLRLGFDIPAGLRSGDGARMDIIDEESEMWVLMPATFVGQDETGEMLDSGDNVRTLRDDTKRLALIMAGAIARYINERVKAQFVFQGLLPWGDQIGSILTAVQQGDNTQNVGAPITSIEWVVGKSPKTIVRTGYA